MANQYYNFYYDPVRQGYDSSSWRTLYGDPIVSGTRLDLQNAAILHYADILRADTTFGLNIPAPASGDDRKVGLIQYNKNAYIYFKISNDVLTAETSNGTTTNSSVITWQSAWTSTNTEFRIKWEAGTATFYVNGNIQAVIQDVSIPGDPLSLYLANSSPNGWFLDYIDVKSIQSYLMSEGNDDSIFGPIVSEFDRITVSENVDLTGQLGGISVNSALTVSENLGKNNS